MLQIRKKAEGEINYELRITNYDEYNLKLFLQKTFDFRLPTFDFYVILPSKFNIRNYFLTSS